jgi:hypothetical protein
MNEAGFGCEIAEKCGFLFEVMSDRETQLFHTKPARNLRLMMQVNGAIYLSLSCPFGEHHEATVDSHRIHDLFIILSTALVTKPGDNCT